MSSYLSYNVEPKNGQIQSDEPDWAFALKISTVILDLQHVFQHTFYMIKYTAALFLSVSCLVLLNCSYLSKQNRIPAQSAETIETAKKTIFEFQTQDGKTLRAYFSEVANPRAYLVLVQGRGESAVKYEELVQDLNTLGYSVYTYDHRGQGFSTRLTKDRQKSHIENFQNYVDDLKLFVDKFVTENIHNKPILVGHSMGGLISSLYLAQNPNAAEKLFLTAPAFSIQSEHSKLAIKAATCISFISAPTEYAKGKGPFDPALAFENNKYTTSPERFSASRQALIQAGIAIGGPTNRWVCETVRATEQLAKNLSRLNQIKVYIASASDEREVRNEDHLKTCNQLASCYQKTYQGRHELWLETDKTRTELLADLDDFILKK